MLQPTPPLTAALALLLAATLAGCNHAVVPRTTTVRLSRPATYAISVSLAGGLQPTATQWAAVQSTFARLLAREGITLVSDLGLADRILRIELTPDPEDPENRGQATVLSVRNNPQYGATSPAAPWLDDDRMFPSPFGWGWGWGWSAFPLFPGYGAYFGYAGYYGYGNAYYDGYSYSAPTLNPRRPHHDHRCDPRKADSPEKPSHRHHPEPPPDGKRPPLLAENSPTSAAPVVYPSRNPASTSFPDDIRLYRGSRSVAGGTESRGEGYRGRSERSPTDAESPRSWLSRALSAADAGAGSSSPSRHDPRSESRYAERTANRADGGGTSGERSWSRQEGSSGRSDSSSRTESTSRGSPGSSYSSSSGSSASSSSGSYSNSSSSSSGSSSSGSYSSSSSSSYSGSSSSSSSGSSSSGSSSSSNSGSTGSNRVER